MSKRCKHVEKDGFNCGSYAFNLYKDGVYQDDLCDVHYWQDQAQRKPLTNGEIYTAYVEAANQTLRPQDERIAFAFARAIEAAHGIKENP